MTASDVIKPEREKERYGGLEISPGTLKESNLDTGDGNDGPPRKFSALAGCSGGAEGVVHYSCPRSGNPVHRDDGPPIAYNLRLTTHISLEVWLHGTNLVKDSVTQTDPDQAFRTQKR
jgi:hypothetical protein